MPLRPPTLLALLLGVVLVVPSAQADTTSDRWSFQPVDLSVGQRLPNVALPTTTSHQPVFLHELLGGEKTILHIFAGW